MRGRSGMASHVVAQAPRMCPAHFPARICVHVHGLMTSSADVIANREATNKQE